MYKKLIDCSGILLIITTVCTMSGCASSSADRYANEAQAYLSKADEKDPAYSENLRKAIESSSKAIELDHKNIVAYSVRGTAYLIQKQYEKAVDDFSEAIKIEPKGQRTMGAYTNRSIAYEFLGKHELSVKDRQAGCPFPLSQEQLNRNLIKDSK